MNDPNTGTGNLALEYIQAVGYGRTGEGCIPKLKRLLAEDAANGRIVDRRFFFVLPTGEHTFEYDEWTDEYVSSVKTAILEISAEALCDAFDRHFDTQLLRTVDGCGKVLPVPLEHLYIPADGEHPADGPIPSDPCTGTGAVLWLDADRTEELRYLMEEGRLPSHR